MSPSPMRSGSGPPAPPVNAGPSAPAGVPAGVELPLGPTGLPVLTELDVAVGWPLGLVPLPEAPERVEPDPARALRELLRSALSRPPCVVAFSGGRDSSLLLALAADVAAREGLPAPIALTSRFPDDPAAAESDWQELVIRHLAQAGLRPEWIREDLTTELDNIGPLTAPLLRAHGGPTFPAGLGNSVLLARHAAGGTLVTGNGGDEVLGEHRMGVLRTLVRRRGRGLSAADWRLVAASAAPAWLRRALPRAEAPALPWLRGAALDAARRAARLHARTPLRWSPGVWATLAPRAVLINNVTRERVCADHGCRLVEPLGSAEFVASYAAFGGNWGGITRTRAIRLLGGGLLPEALVRRGQKAAFNASRFSEPTRRFAREWDGHGIDPELVDVEQLRAAWLAEVAPAPTGMLLQQAWLARAAGSP